MQMLKKSPRTHSQTFQSFDMFMVHYLVGTSNGPLKTKEALRQFVVILASIPQ